MTRRDLMKSILFASVPGAPQSLAALASVPGVPQSLAAAKQDKIVLMLDEKCVAASQDIGFHLNPAKKHPDNPVLLPGEPHQWDSLQVGWPATVLYSVSDRKFRCWYSGLDALQKDRSAVTWPTGYAESDDGIHWRKPDLGQVTFHGRPTNQIRPDWKIDGYAAGTLCSAFENPSPDALPSQRFGGDWSEAVVLPSGGKDRRRFAWSPDGISWTPAGLLYQLRLKGRHFNVSQLLCMPDADDPESRVIAFAQAKRPRSWDGRVVRQIGAMRGPSVENIKDSGDAVLLAPENGIDEELHFASVSRVGNTFLMLFESDRFARNPIHGDLRLAIGTDGRHFRRVHPRDAVVSTGPKGVWDENLLVTTTSAMQEVGDEVYIFYIGCPNVFNSWPKSYSEDPDRRGSLMYPTYLGLAMLLRDRYGYAAGNGTLISNPIELRGALWLNAEGEALEVTAADSSGKQASHGRLGRERFQTVYRKVVWSGTPPTGSLQLRIRLSDSDKLYSIRS
jgi:hypothetical protein